MRKRFKGTKLRTTRTIQIKPIKLIAETRIFDSNSKKGVIRMESMIMRATPTLYGQEAVDVRKEVMRTPSKRNKERQKMLLEVLDRVTK